MAQDFLYINSDGVPTESTGAYETSDHVSSSAGAGDAGKPIVLDGDGNIDASMINDGDISHDSTGGAAASTVHTAFPLLAGGRDFTAIQQYDGDKTFTANSNQIPDVKWVTEQITNAQVGDEWEDSVLDIQTDATLDPGASPTTGDRYIIENAAALHANFGTINTDANGDADTLADDDIVEYDGTKFFIAMSPTTGTFTSDDSDNNKLKYFNGSAWVDKDFEATTASLGCQISGLDVRADLYASGGIALSTNSMYVDVDVLVGEGLTTTGSAPTKDMVIDWSTAFNDSKAIKASDFASNADDLGAHLIGIHDPGTIITATTVEGALVENRTAIDAIEDNTITSPNSTISVGGTVGGDDQTVDITWSTAFNDAKAVKAEDLNSTTNGEGASIIGIEDSAGNFDATNVEAALAELAQRGTVYTVGSAVDKGDLVYVSANDSVAPHATLTADNYGIGLAATTEASGTVKVLANDTVLTNVLTTATAGDKYYWTGSAYSTSMPTGAGAHVWRVGVAKNATDLHVQVELVKRNHA